MAVPATIASQWESYRQRVLVPAGAGPVQTEETKRAFYAASFSMLQAFLGISEDEDEEKFAARMEAMMDECLRFADAL